MGESTGTSAAVPTVQFETERVRVTEWRFAPGAATGWHRHPYDYVVVPLTSGTLKLVGEPGGKNIHSELVAGQAYARNAGVEHDVVNTNDGEFVFIEVELK